MRIIPSVVRDDCICPAEKIPKDCIYYTFDGENFICYFAGDELR